MGVAIGAFGLVAWVASPLWVPIMLGVVMAASASHPYAALVRRFGERRKPWLAAFITIVSGIGVAAIGTTIVLLAVHELSTLVAYFSKPNNFGSIQGVVGGRAERAMQSIDLDTQHVYEWARGQLEAAARYAATAAAIVVRETTFALLGLIVALITMYYTLIEREGIEQRLERMLPLNPRHTRALLHEASEVGRTAFYGKASCRGGGIFFLMLCEKVYVREGEALQGAHGVLR